MMFSLCNIGGFCKYRFAHTLWDVIRVHSYTPMYKQKSKKNIGRIMVLLAGNVEINDVGNGVFFPSVGLFMWG